MIPTNYGELDIVIDKGRAKVAGKGQQHTGIRPRTAVVGSAPQGLDGSGSPKYDSKLEAAFHQHLLARKKLGEFEIVLFHALTLTLADQTRYTPDFLCRTPDGTIILFETKGFMREAARVRLRVAAALFSWWRFVLVTKHKGQWVEQRI